MRSLQRGIVRKASHRGATCAGRVCHDGSSVLLELRELAEMVLLDRPTGLGMGWWVDLL